jgi:hypothetical protein
VIVTVPVVSTPVGPSPWVPEAAPPLFWSIPNQGSPPTVKPDRGVATIVTVDWKGTSALTVCWLAVSAPLIEMEHPVATLITLSVTGLPSVPPDDDPLLLLPLPDDAPLLVPPDDDPPLLPVGAPLPFPHGAPDVV